MTIAWLVSLWKRIPDFVKFGLCLVLACALGYAAGRWAQPAKVVTKSEVQYKDRVVEKVVTKEAAVRVVYKNVVRTRTVVRAPDGTTTTTVVTDDKSKINNNTVVTSDATKNTTVTSDTIKSTVTTYKPSFRVAVMLGAGVQTASPFWVGAEASYNVVGPLSIGAFVLTNKKEYVVGGTAGLSF